MLIISDCKENKNYTLDKIRQLTAFVLLRIFFLITNFFIIHDNQFYKYELLSCID